MIPRKQQKLKQILYSNTSSLYRKWIYNLDFILLIEYNTLLESLLLWLAILKEEKNEDKRNKVLHKDTENSMHRLAVKKMVIKQYVYSESESGTEWGRGYWRT